MNADTRAVCMQQLRQKIPALDALDSLGESTLRELSQSAMQKSMPSSWQDGNDLIDLAGHQAEVLLSPEHGQAMTRALEENFSALTANHLGADFHPEFIQGDLVFALEALHKGAPAIPVLACGCVSGNNFGYPRGLFFGRGKTPGALPGRFPVLPDKHRHVPLSLREAFGADGPRATLSRAVLRSPDSGLLTPRESEVARTVLAEIFLHPKVLEKKDFAAQACVMNGLLWERLFTPALCPPPLIHLDSTWLALELIRRDLHRPNTLAGQLLNTGQSALRTALRRELNGVRGCWDFRDEGNPALCRGTFLFWGLDSRQCLTPLVPDENATHLDLPDGSSLPFTVPALDAALAERRVLPGLFLSYAVLALARGLFCAGGAYQADYLEKMRTGLARVLYAQGENVSAGKLEQPVSCMITGFLPLRLQEENRNWAAATTDILASGGISPDILDRLGTLPVSVARELALAHLYEDVVPPEEQLPGGVSALSVSGPTGICLP